MSEGAGQRLGRHVLAHQLLLSREGRRRHREDEDASHDHHADVAVCLDEGGADRDAEEFGVRERLGLSRRKNPMGDVVGGLVDQPEQCQEDRHLDKDRQTRGEGVGSGVLVELHRLLGHAFAVVAVLLLKLLDLRLDQLHVAAGFDLLDEQRDQGGPNHQRQPDDREHPGGTRVRREDLAPHGVEAHEHRRDGVVQRDHDRVADVA